MVSDFVGRVLENRQLTEFVFESVLELDKPMIWEAGQYISLQIPNSKFQIPTRRNYSICSMPDNQKSISFCVDTKPNGPGSQLIRSLKPDDKIFFKGPLGKFKIQNSKFKNNIFVATGTGIGPFKAMISQLINKKNSVQLFFGLRHQKDIFYQDFFEDLTNKFSNFKFQIVNSDGGHHVTEFVLPQAETAYYLCGNMNMIKDVTAKLETGGVPSQNIHLESYY
ncbi:FAD-dependent oxidoreductase [Candidatus Gottesmanbacteria bacterium]|nr:FAD-dependent oxidoreductase [Candidatus Gottesmanbacteria bacterium]